MRLSRRVLSYQTRCNVPESYSWVKVEDLVPWERNPKEHGDDIPGIARSIVRFGWLDPIVAWKSQRRIIGGHGRTLAAKLLLTEDAGRMFANDAPGPGLIPVRFVEFSSEMEANAAGVALNRHTERNPMNEEAVAELIREMEEAGASLEGLGYSEEEIAEIVDGGEPELGDPNEDDTPEPPAEPVSKLGEVYELGPHRLVCGDSTKPETWASLLRGERGDMVFTDPPYGVSYEGGHNKKKRAQIANDALAGSDLTGLFFESIAMAVNHTGDHAAFYVWYASGKSVETFAAFGKLPLTLRAIIQWYKVRSGLGAFMAQYIPNCEPCIYAFKNGCSPQWFGPSDEKTVWELQRQGANEYHPTQKPVELSVRAISNSSSPGQIVIDMFGGSGATLIGCSTTKRVCRMIELDPRYCDVIRRRWTAHADANRLDAGPGALRDP